MAFCINESSKCLDFESCGENKSHHGVVKYSELCLTTCTVNIYSVDIGTYSCDVLTYTCVFCIIFFSIHCIRVILNMLRK